MTPDRYDRLPEDVFREILDVFKTDSEHPKLEPLLDEFACRVKDLMQGMRRPFVTLWQVGYDELLNYEAAHYLLYHYGLKLTLLDIARQLMLSVEPLQEGSGYQGFVIRKWER